MLDTSVDAVKRARATLAGEVPERLTPPAPRSAAETALLARFAEAFLADDVDGMVKLVTEHAWFRMPPSYLEYQGTAKIRGLLTAVAIFRTGQPSRLLATRANGQPAYGVYRLDPASGQPRPAGLLLLSLTGSRIAALTWFIGPSPLAQLGLPSAPSAAELVSPAR